MSKLSESLTSGQFTITCELNPPKGIDLTTVYKQADMLSSLVDAFNITDSASSIMKMSPMAASHLLLDKGVETILQITGRDRNRIALQSDLLAASALGVNNVLCLTGDPPGSGDHPDAKAVFDLDGIQLLQAIRSLSSGVDISGKTLDGSPSFYPGAAVNPGSNDLDKELRRMEEKVAAGAMFFQTQAVYEAKVLEKFMKGAEKFNVPVLVGLIILKSSKMAQNLNSYLPGVNVPPSIMVEMDGAKTREEKRDVSTKISSRLIRELKDMCQGIHIMAIGWESIVPNIIQESGIN